MNGNCFGTLFRVSTWGESHGPSLGALVDGCPSGLALAEEDFQGDLARRQGGQAAYTTPRKEADRVRIESGVFEGRTTGTPICLRIENGAQQSADYDSYRDVPRPGHADFTTFLKHHHRDHRGGGRSSARETAARTAAGVVAKKILGGLGVEMAAWLSQVGPHAAPGCDELSLAQLRALPTPFAAELEALRTRGESWGGRVRCRVDGLPAGLGEPVFDKLQALLAHGLMSLPAAVGFEAGGGFAMSAAPGSEIRDAIGAGPKPLSNRHGGLLGGMTTGSPLFVSVAFHAPTSIPAPIGSRNLRTGAPAEVTVGGRHDAFPLPRILPVVEAMVAITLVDCLLRAGRLGEKLTSP